jgi:hypothetical protein
MYDWLTVSMLSKAWKTAHYAYQHWFEELLFFCCHLLQNLFLLFISEPNKRHLTERKNEHAPPTPVSQKPKLSKAERRAIQESQRAAKAAAKEAGS